VPLGPRHAVVHALFGRPKSHFLFGRLTLLRFTLLPVAIRANVGELTLKLIGPRALFTDIFGHALEAAFTTTYLPGFRANLSFGARFAVGLSFIVCGGFFASRFAFILVPTVPILLPFIVQVLVFKIVFGISRSHCLSPSAC
jgi:hypothetical protein